MHLLNSGRQQIKPITSVLQQQQGHWRLCAHMRQAGCMPESSKHGSWRVSRLSVGMLAKYAMHCAYPSALVPSPASVRLQRVHVA